MNVLSLDRFWVILICAYFMFQTIYRTVIGQGLELDEAEVFVTGQALRPGYNDQPPLYTWIQFAAFSLFSESIFALALVKNALLSFIYLALYKLLRTEYPPETAGLAACSLLLLPQIAWESQRALTHSVLVTAMASITCYVLWRLKDARSWLLYALFGLVAGLGLLSKYNFGVFLAAIMISALWSPQTRPIFASPRIMASLAVGVAVLALPFYWILANAEFAFASASKLKIDDRSAPLVAAVTGIGNTLLAALGFCALAFLVAGLLYARYRQAGHADADKGHLRPFLTRIMLVAFVLVFLLVVISGTTHVKDRWMMPFLFLFAPVLVLYLLPSLSILGRRRLAQVFTTIAGIVVVALPINILFGDFGGASHRTAPFADLARTIEETNPDVEAIFSNRYYIAGNLRHRLDLPVATTRWQPDDLMEVDNVVLVWNSGRPEAAQKMLAEYERVVGRKPEPGQVVSFESPYTWRADQIFRAWIQRTD